jgi:acetyl-CoA carboxylase beta subunit
MPQDAVTGPPRATDPPPAGPATAPGVEEWVVCAGCRSVLYGKKFLRNLKVCADCGHHHRLGAPERIDQLFDPGTVRRPAVPVAGADVLGFVDTMPYPDRLEAARRRTGLPEAVLVVSGEIGGWQLVAAVMDFRFLAGSLGAAVGELVAAAAGTALRRR